MINIVLYQPEKPANTGNIMRTCVATDSFLHIIGPTTFSLDEKSLKRAGMDYIDDLKFRYYKDVDEFYLLNPNATIYYVTRYSNHLYSKADYSSIDDLYLMFGRESTGIDKDILRKNIEHTIRIPMTPTSRSLNLSNSVAIVLYEVLRQKNYFGLSTYESIKGEDFLFKKK